MKNLSLFIVVLLIVGVAGWWWFAAEPVAVTEPPAADAPAATFANVTADGERLEIFAEDEMVAELSLATFLAWTEEYWDEVFAERPAFGEIREVDHTCFNRFDETVSLSPDGQLVAFSVHDYAAASSLTFVGIYRLSDETIELIPAQNHGNISELFWSPDSALLAYSLDTARAMGDALSVDSVISLEKLQTIETEDLLVALGDTETDWRDIMPEIRDLAWESDTTLRFTSNDPSDETESLTWSLATERYPFLKTTILSIITKLIQRIWQNKGIEFQLK